MPSPSKIRNTDLSRLLREELSVRFSSFSIRAENVLRQRMDADDDVRTPSLELSRTYPMQRL